MGTLSGGQTHVDRLLELGVMINGSLVGTSPSDEPLFEQIYIHLGGVLSE